VVVQFIDDNTLIPYKKTLKRSFKKIMTKTLKTFDTNIDNDEAEIIYIVLYLLSLYKHTNQYSLEEFAYRPIGLLAHYDV